MSAALFSETNIVNSISQYLATQLLAAGYLLYWHHIDAVQINGTSTGWYLNWSVNGATYLAQPTVQTVFTAARGLLTLTGEIPAVPRFVIRLIDDTSIGPADVVAVPTLSVEVGPALPVSNYELGARTKWRSRHLIVDGYLRGPQDAPNFNEQALFKDFLALWFDNEQPLAVQNHDDGSLAAVGTVTVMDSVVRHATLPQAPDPTTYQVLLNARLVYVA